MQEPKINNLRKTPQEKQPLLAGGCFFILICPEQRKNPTYSRVFSLVELPGIAPGSVR